MKALLLTLLFLTPLSSRAETVALSQQDAVKFCQTQNQHLLSAREWAGIAVQRGAKGIRETAYPWVSANDPQVLEEIRRNESEGYQTIYFTKNAPAQIRGAPWAGDFVDFYYTRAGYVKPDNGEDQQEFWSSSVNLKVYDWAWYFRGVDGFLTFQDRRFPAAVRCQP